MSRVECFVRVSVWVSCEFIWNDVLQRSIKYETADYDHIYIYIWEICWGRLKFHSFEAVYCLFPGSIKNEKIDNIFRTIVNFPIVLHLCLNVCVFLLNSRTVKALNIYTNIQKIILFLYVESWTINGVLKHKLPHLIVP